MKRYRSPEEIESAKRSARLAAARRQQDAKPFVPTPHSQGPRAQAAHQAGGKLIGINFDREKFDAMLAKYAPGCGTPIRVAGTNEGSMPCGAKLSGVQQFCPYCEPHVQKPTPTAESVVRNLLDA